MKFCRVKNITLCSLLLAIAVTACAKKTAPPSPPPTEQGTHQTPPTVPPTTPTLPDRLPEAGFYNNSESTPLLDLVNASEKSIDIEIYQMTDADVRTALRRALARKVKIRVVKEPAPVNDSCDVFAPIAPDEKSPCLDQKKLRKEIIAQGGDYVPFNKDNLCADSRKPCFEHGKMVIADKKAVLISTGNFNSSNLCNLAQNPARCNRDFSMIARESEVVTFLSNLFEKDLKGDAYNVKAMLFSGRLRERITVSPYSLEPLTQLIDSATLSIRIVNQYLNEPNLNQALIRAAARGVKVEMTLASACSFAPPTLPEIKSLGTLFKSFDQAGFSVRMLPSQLKINGKPGYLHAKAIVIDDKTAWVGSVNGSSAALSNNREFGMIFSEQKWVAPLIKILDTDHASPDVETWQESLLCKKDAASLNH